MRSADDVLADIEDDRLQREAEIRLIENLASGVKREDEERMLRRSLVLLTYSHLEGFCRFALFAYASAVNSARVPCKEAVVPLVAATLTSVFGALRELNRKHPYFSRALPHDQKLHMSAREQLFVENYERISAQIIQIPDAIVDTESNLKAAVLKKMLFQLGLDFTKIDPYVSPIERLLGVRNSIAHGDRIKVPSERECSEFMGAAFSVMRAVQHEVYSALAAQTYRRDVA
jgi:hypothetical protein